MIGIDTNVLLRLLVRDDDHQVRVAEQFITSRCSAESPGHVSTIVVAEMAWALKEIYGYDRPQIAAAIRGLMKISSLDVELAEDVGDAVSDFEKSVAGFTDCLLARANAAAGCDYTITFDRKAARLAGFKLLPAR